MRRKRRRLPLAPNLPAHAVQAERSFNPASNMKLVTTLAALDALGPQEAEGLQPCFEMRLTDLATLRIVKHQGRRHQLPRHSHGVQGPEVHGPEIVPRERISPADRRPRERRGRGQQEETQAQTDAQFHA